ncbi:hypothetical protein DFH09DRAFT_1477788 [Mycena vulgaris]|nr:hypothetical protein DFH09DRAFT_1477788 [Mycena vulgaris]
MWVGRERACGGDHDEGVEHQHATSRLRVASTSVAMVQVQKRILTKPPLQTSPRLSFSRAPGASTTWGGKTSKSSRRGAAGVASRRKRGEYFKECEKEWLLVRLEVHEGGNSRWTSLNGCVGDGRKKENSPSQAAPSLFFLLNHDTLLYSPLLPSRPPSPPPSPPSCPPSPSPGPNAKGSKGGKRGKGKKAAPKKQVTDKGESAPPPRGRKADNQPVPENDSAQQSDARRTKRVRRSPEEAKLEREQRIATTIKPGAKPSYEYVENLKSPVKPSKKRSIAELEFWPELKCSEDLRSRTNVMPDLKKGSSYLITTNTLLGSDLDVKHPAWRDKRRLRDAVLSRKDASTPAGLLWAGILDQYEQDLKLPSSRRYIRIVRMEGELKIAVTMDTYLANLIHEVQYLVPDFTFKRIKGLLNEWEVAVWLDEDKERVLVARIYCNKATSDAFFYIFDGFFMAIKQVTGRAVRFKAFDPDGNIISINFDTEAAQVQGFARALLKLLGNMAPHTDPDVIVRYVVKLCSVHFTRSTDALVGAVGQATVQYLNRIRGLKKPEDIEAWHKFCREHPNKKLQDWYEHKIRYSWLLPGFNESLSLFPTGFWDRTPHHTNLVESAHVATNRETGTLLFPLEAIQRARAFDAQRAAAIAATRDTCILTNHNNNDRSRMRRAVGRQKHAQKRREEHTTLENGPSEAVQRLQDLSEAKKTAAARVKELKEEKKAMGRAPRNIHLGDKDGNAAMIPTVSPSTPSEVEGESDSDIEMLDDAASAVATSTPSRFSSPPRSGASDFEDYELIPSFTSEFGATSDWESGASEPDWTGDGEDVDEDVYNAPHVGHYLLGAPGFNLEDFLARVLDFCERKAFPLLAPSIATGSARRIDDALEAKQKTNLSGGVTPARTTTGIPNSILECSVRLGQSSLP